MSPADPPTPRKIALLANCLLNQNAKVCEGAHYRGVVNPVIDALRSRGYQLLQLPCPELAFAGADLHWRRLAPLLRRRSVALPPCHLIRRGLDIGLEQRRLEAFLSDYDLSADEQQRWRV